MSVGEKKEFRKVLLLERILTWGNKRRKKKLKLGYVPGRVVSRVACVWVRLRFDICPP